MNFWNQLPLFRILIPFIAGIIFSVSFPDAEIPIYYLLFAGFVFLLAAMLYTRIFKNFGSRWIYGFLLNVFIFLLSYHLTASSFNTQSTNHLIKSISSSDTVVATVCDPVVERENSYKVVLEVNAIKKDGMFLKANGKVMTYFQKDSSSAALKYGDKLLIASAFTEIKGVQNPAEFDYKKYLSMRSVFLQSYIKSGKWSLLDEHCGNIIRQYALDIRDRFLKIFRDYNVSGDEYAVAGALILGYTDKLDQDLINMYSGSGALHILSVSGMHVGVVFIVLNFLLAFLDKTRKGKYIKPVILILMIWFYAAITGLSPAVNRAAAMITFIIIGKMIGRETNIYNTLAASALFLLILNPLLLYDVGFQLSYIAVFGIVLLQKNIEKLWCPSNWLMKQVWSIISISLAAQMATFPLSIYYFHQFPNYFLLTNLVVVPFSNLIIYSGMIMLLVSPLNFLAVFFSEIFVYMLQGMNYAIKYIESLPYAVTHAITLNTAETILLYIMISLVIAFFFYKRNILLKMAAISAIAFFCMVGIDKFNAITQKKMIVYQLKKSTAIDLVQGKSHIFITDSAAENNSKMIMTHINNNWIQLRLNDPLIIRKENLTDSLFTIDNGSTTIYGNVLQFYNKRIAIVDKQNFRYASDTPIAIDYLVVSGNIKADMEELMETYYPAKIIFDSSNSLWRTEKWIKECEKYHVPYYSVLKSGAYVEEL